MSMNLLPIGSVVKLEEAEKALLIIGIAIEREEGDSFDYMGVPYPEGYIDSETMFLFNHKDIEKVEFLGYINAEAQAFRARYGEMLKENGYNNEDGDSK